MAIKKYKNERRSSKKPSVYIADPKEKEPHGGVIKGGKSSRAKGRKMDLAETKAKNKKRVTAYKKWETTYRTSKYKYKAGK